jgi:hypothetical protein
MQSLGIKLPERSISAIVVFLYKPSPIAVTAALPSAHFDKISFLKSRLCQSRLLTLFILFYPLKLFWLISRAFRFELYFNESKI